MEQKTLMAASNRKLFTIFILTASSSVMAGGSDRLSDAVSKMKSTEVNNHSISYQDIKNAHAKSVSPVTQSSDPRVKDIRDANTFIQNVTGYLVTCPRYGFCLGRDNNLGMPTGYFEYSRYYRHSCPSGWYAEQYTTSHTKPGCSDCPSTTNYTDNYECKKNIKFVYEE